MGYLSSIQLDWTLLTRYTPISSIAFFHIPWVVTQNEMLLLFISYVFDCLIYMLCFMRPSKLLCMQYCTLKVYDMGQMSELLTAVVKLTTVTSCFRCYHILSQTLLCSFVKYGVEAAGHTVDLKAPKDGINLHSLLWRSAGCPKQWIQPPFLKSFWPLDFLEDISSRNAKM